jgi:hypothetical protein
MYAFSWKKHKMKPSRGMGAVRPSKRPKGVNNSAPEGGPVPGIKKGGKAGLYENIHKKQARIAAGSGEKMRKPGSKGAPSSIDFTNSAKTAKAR